MKKDEYQAAFRKLLEPCLNGGTPISREKLFGDPSLGDAKKETKTKHLKDFLKENIDYFGCVQGVLPPVESLIDLAEARMGEKISEENVVVANRICADIVDQAFRPVVEEVVRTGLNQFVHEDGLQVSMKDLMQFLLGDFAEFTKGAGNGLVSVAGAINEKLLVRCLLAAGLDEDDFGQTGTESEGDIMVHARGGKKENLGVEIKSYHARERLLRGLRDVDRPKVGAGYFIDHTEFNEGRTKLLLQTQAAAIYMPTETLCKVSEKAKNLQSQDMLCFGSKFYRPLEQFATDMAHFVKWGRLPDYS